SRTASRPPNRRPSPSSSSASVAFTGGITLGRHECSVDEIRRWLKSEGRLRQVRGAACGGETRTPLSTNSSGAALAAVPTWRVRAVIHGLFEEFLGRKRPELRHVVKRVDHCISSVAVLHFHFADVNVLNHVLIAVQPHRAPRGIRQLHPAKRPQQPFSVL